MLKLNLKTGRFYARRESPEGLTYWLHKPSSDAPFKAIMVSDVNGIELEFPDVHDPDEIKPGAKVNEGGKPANDNYLLPDGRRIVCKDGRVTEIKQPALIQARMRRNEFQRSLGFKC